MIEFISYKEFMKNKFDIPLTHNSVTPSKNGPLFDYMSSEELINLEDLCKYIE